MCYQYSPLPIQPASRISPSKMSHTHQLEVIGG